MRGFSLPFEHRASLPFSVEFFNEEVTRASYAGSHAVKVPITTRG